ncbi:MAG TPA: ABC transporter ATP-binding protein [Thermohalobaculum sp.]|nr:ABC transporter ATP-binding protein [Thermohalobaculum sp.]
MAEPLLAFEGVSAGYGAGHVIEDVTLALAPGERLGMLGRNGAGKTTLLRTALGLTRLHAGRIRIGGRDMSGLAPHARARAGLGLVPQTRDIFPSLSVEENLIAGAHDARPDLGRAYALFPRLAERRRIGGTRLSGGEQQMLAVARTLMGRPRVLMLDEPLEGLAPALSDELMAAFERLSAEEGHAVLLVESRIEAALAFAGRIALLDAGRLAWTGPPAELERRPDLLERHLGLGAAG